MGLSDDIIVSVIIVIFIILIGVFVLNKTVNREQTTVSDAYQDSLRDTHSIAFDAVLHLKEEITKKPFEILLGDYMASGRMIFPTPNGTVNLRTAIRKRFDVVYGPGNYYLKLSPKITDVHISFVFDGSPSMNDERIELSQRVNPLIKEVDKIFNETGAKTHLHVYILTPKEQIAACKDFPIDVDCKAVSFNGLYSSKRVELSIPGFGYTNFTTWKSSNPFMKEFQFAQADWVAGTQYAADKYLDLLTKAPDQQSIHIIIPVTDQLSTGSIPNSCYNISNNLGAERAFSDNTVCALCDETCPVHRSDENLVNVEDFMNKTGMFVIPVFSFSCSFTYNPSWNTDVKSTPYTSTFGSFPLPPGDSICNLAACMTACTAKPQLDQYCFRTQCHNSVRAQMQSFATSKNPDAVIDISDSSKLTSSVIQQIQNAYDEMQFEIGVLDNNRTRYVVDRTLLLPDGTRTNITVRVYEQSFKDDTKPNIIRAWTLPVKTRTGGPLVIFANVSDDSTIDHVYAHVIMPNNAELSWSLNELPIEGMWKIVPLTTGLLDNGTYWINIEAVDAAGNIAKLEHATSFEVNNTDLDPPTLSRIWIEPTAPKPTDAKVTLHVEASDAVGIFMVKANITSPSRVSIEKEFVFSGSDYTTQISPLEAGGYAVNVTVIDVGRNEVYGRLQFGVCAQGMMISDDGASCIDPMDLVKYPIDTSCTRGWVAGQPGEGALIKINNENYACDLFEVKNQTLLDYAKETATCFKSNCGGNCHAGCTSDYTASGSNLVQNTTNFKKFAAYYIIDGLGPAATYMHDYFQAEINCVGGNPDVPTPSCVPVSGITAGLLADCRLGTELDPGYGSWESDTQMNLNTCRMTDEPAHASLDILKTGTCVDYSTSLTTLLRYVGYKKNEVYSISAPCHEYNIVKFPGATKWHIVDTTGNTGGGIDASWSWDCPGAGMTTHCTYEPNMCANDGGMGACPSRSEVSGC